MRNLLRNFLLLTLCGLAPVLALAQDKKTITGATLQMSVGDDTKFFLNGRLVLEHDPNTYNDAEFSEKGHFVYKFKDDQLCYFQPANLFAFQSIQTYQKSTDFNNYGWAGVAYILTLTFSDNTEKNFTSSDVNQQLQYDVTNAGDTDPEGWKSGEVDESAWKRPAVENHPPAFVAQKLNDPQTHRPPSYLRTFQASDDNGDFGNDMRNTRRDFRRKFALGDIDPAPGCQPFKPTATPTHAYQKPTATPTRTPVPTATPRPKPTATYTRTPRPIPTATSTRVPRPPKATFTPTDAPKPRVVKLIPTSTPRPLKKVKVPPTPTRAQWIPPTATPTLRRRAWPTSTPVRHQVPATFTPTVEIAEYAPTTIVFVEPPVNIYVEFADGPGLYKLEVMDASGKHLKTLFEHRMVGESDQWISWDGKNEQGHLMPYGEYYAHFTRSGKLLRNIVLTWIREKNNE